MDVTVERLLKSFGDTLSREVAQEALPSHLVLAAAVAFLGSLLATLAVDLELGPEAKERLRAWAISSLETLPL